MNAIKRQANSVSTFTTFVFVSLLVYFSYHAVSGDRGLLALTTLSQQVSESKKKLDIANMERLQLEHKVSLLRDESLDLDLLDEQARKILGYVAHNENVYNITYN